MSGHSKWSTIKRKKGAADAKKGKIFSRIIKEITLAVRLGGGDINGNPRLRQAVAEAKAENMPKDNMERAIKKASGDVGEGVSFEEVTYEGYGPGGVAVLVEAVTDNKKRTVAEIRHVFAKYGGNLAENGCVSWMFERKGSLVFNKRDVSEDVLMEVVLEAGGEDIIEEESEYEVITEPGSFDALKKAVDEAGLKYTFAQLSMVPQNTVQLNGQEAEQMLKLMEKMEECDDVQNVYANFDISDEIMEKLSQ